MDLIKFAKINNTDKCLELLDKKRGDLKADTNYKMEDEFTALHYACLNGNARLVSLLLYHDATIDCENNKK
jgi:ankyrin repeat protein